MFYNNKGKSFEENVHFNIPFEDDKNKNKDKNQNKTGKAKGRKFSPSIGLDIKSGNININPSFSATVPIAGPFEAKFGPSSPVKSTPLNLAEAEVKPIFHVAFIKLAVPPIVILDAIKE